MNVKVDEISKLTNDNNFMEQELNHLKLQFQENTSDYETNIKKLTTELKDMSNEKEMSVVDNELLKSDFKWSDLHALSLNLQIVLNSIFLDVFHVFNKNS